MYDGRGFSGRQGERVGKADGRRWQGVLSGGGGPSGSCSLLPFPALASRKRIRPQRRSPPSFSPGVVMHVLRKSVIAAALLGVVAVAGAQQQQSTPTPASAAHASAGKPPLPAPLDTRELVRSPAPPDPGKRFASIPPASARDPGVAVRLT